MNLKQKKRFIWLLLMVIGVSIAVAFVLVALNKNINLYYTPSQLTHNQRPLATLRIGGLVKKGSVKRGNNNLQISFVITDLSREVSVFYNGIVPSLFREGQGIIAEGRFENNLFVARQVLAKHDENYLPPGIKKVVEQ